MPLYRSLVTCAGAWLCVIASTGLSTMAQAPSDPEWGVLPSHRYLPPPQGARSVLDQVKLLEQLNQSVGQQATSDALQLSPKQLELLDDLVESFRNEQGELELPKPDSIPKQWIENLLPDPKQREQAKRMLEQLAREHQLPLNEDSGLPLPDDLKSPQPIPADKPGSTPRSGSTPQSSQSTQPGSARKSGEASEPGQPAGDGQPQSKSTDNADPSVPDSNSLPGGIPKEYRELFDKLKQFEQQKRRSLESKAPWQPEGDTAQPGDRTSRKDPARGNAGANANPRNGNATNGGNQQRPPIRRREDPLSSSSTTKPGKPAGPASPADNLRNKANDANRRNDSLFSDQQPAEDRFAPSSAGRPDNDQFDQRQPGFAPADKTESAVENLPANRDVNPGTSSRESRNAPTPKLPQAMPEIPDSENPFSKGFQPLAPSQSESADPGKPRTAPRFNITRMSEQPKPENNGNRTDVRQSIEQSGLAQSLKKIVQNAIKEQEAERIKAARQRASQAANSGSTPDSTPERNDSLQDLVRSAEAASKTAAAEQAAQRAGIPQAPVRSPAPNSRQSADNGGWSGGDNRNAEKWARWANDIWNSVSVMPDEAPRSQSPQASSSSGLGLPEFRWTNSMTAVVIGLAIVLGLVFWFSRRQLVEIAAGSQRQAEWVKTVLSDGLKTRADVVRAFHLLVGRGQGVADWWNHRVVVGYFNGRSPQYATAISELANVYEHARYYPDDAELSPEQLEQVRRIVRSLSQSQI